MSADYILLGDLDLHDCFLNKIDNILAKIDIIEKRKFILLLKK